MFRSKGEKRMATATNGDLRHIPVASILENVHSLRGVKKDTEEYQNLVASVKKRGILNPIVVKELKDPDDPDKVNYGLIDGLQRFNAALDAGLKEVPAHVKDMTRAQIEEAQLVANLNKIETKHAEYAKHLQRILERNPTMSLKQLAQLLDCSEQWIKQRLSLLKLPENIQKLVDEGKVTLVNGHELSKLPEDEVNNFLERAMTERSDQFVPQVAERLKELREAKRQGRAPKEEEFKPHAYQRPWGEVKEEFNNPVVGKQLINKHNIKSPVEAWNMAVAWCCQMDPDTQAQRVEKDKQKKAEAKKRAEDRKAEREKKRQDEAAAAREGIEKEGEFKPHEEPEPANA